jgi:hypothetical protein
MGRLKIQQDDMASRERVRWEPIGRANPPTDQMTKPSNTHLKPRQINSEIEREQSDWTDLLMGQGGRG